MSVEMILSSPAVIWIALAVVLAAIEAFTMGLTSIWFAGGAFAAAICAIAGLPVIGPIIVFVAVSLVLLLVTGPWARKKLNRNVEKTNVNAIVGARGIVEEPVSSSSPGRVRLDGKLWTASPADYRTGEIAKGAAVTVKEIKGVTLFVIEEGDKND